MTLSQFVTLCKKGWLLGTSASLVFLGLAVYTSPETSPSPKIVAAHDSVYLCDATEAQSELLFVGCEGFF